MPLSDVIFVSYDEPHADENFARLRAFAPRAVRLHGVSGIYNAYQAAADLSTTPFFFMVDADAWILDGSGLGPAERGDGDIYSWFSVNAVNGLRGRTGSLKLMRREVVRTMDSAAVDFFSSMRGVRKVVRVVASENRFNASPYLTWRGAYRECAKLSSGLVRNPNGEALHTWLTVGADKPFGLWSLIGARMGARLGADEGLDAVAKINSHAFLAQTFEGLDKSLEGLEVR